MSNFKAFNTGAKWFVADSDGDGDPIGAIIGSYKSQTEADAQIKEMLADHGVHGGVFNQYASGFKMINNDSMFVAWYSNAAEDLQHEYFPRLATDQYIARVDSKMLPMPDLWFYHLRGAKHGNATILGRVGLMTLGIGTFDDSPIAEKFKSYYRDNKVQMSHGFLYDPRQFRDGAYHYYNTFEITTLPPGHAANPYTSLEVFDMFDAAKIKALEAAVGSADAELILKGSAAASKQIAEMGAKFKAMNEPPAANPDKDDDDPKTNAAEKAIGVRVGNVETAVVEGFKALTMQIAGVLTPIAQQIAAGNKANEALVARVDVLQNGVKAIVDFLKSEMAMQPPATQAPSTLVQPNDPGMMLMQAMQQQAGGQNQQFPQGQKGNDPLGVFTPIFQSLNVGGKAMHPSPFEVPGAFGSNAAIPTQQGQQPMPQQQPAQGQQLPQFQQPQGNQPPAGMNGFVQSLLGQPAPNQINNQPGVGIPRLG